MEIVRTFKDAFAIGKECLSKINTSKSKPRLMDDYALPLNIDDGPWEQSETALYQTLSYIMNFLNHSCYMLCVAGDEQKIVKLETKEMSQFFQDILTNDVRKKQDPKINRTLLDDKQRLKKMRIMQCVVKPYASSSATSSEYEDMFKKINAPDGVYILNLTDAVILRKNGMIPWKLNRNVNLPTAYQIDRFIPVLSISGEEGYWDIPIPNYDDVQYVLKDTHPDPNYELTWAKKKSKAVFRGGPTGCGVSENTNMRIRLAKMGLEQKYAKYLDVGIVSNKPNTIDSDAIRYDPRVGLAYMNTFIKPVARMPMSDQSKFKYIIHIDGNVHAYRLLTTMRTGSVILRVKSDYTSWIDHLMNQENLEGNRLYVSVKADLSDLISQIEYCDQHSEECQLIAERALKFAESVMTQSYVVNAFEAVLWKLSELLNNKQTIPLGKTIAELQNNNKYAIVEGDNTEYYVQNEKTKAWQKDPLIQSIMNMNVKNSDDVLCVLQDMCFASSFNSERKGDEDDCISEAMTKEKIKTNLFEQFYKHFDNAYFLSKEELNHTIEKEAEYSSNIYKTIEYIKTSRLLAENNANYELGKTATILNIPVSPIQEMVNLIIEDRDASRKRRLIISLIDSKKYVYQGIATEDSTVYVGEKENEWWYYCVQTHVKLLPKFQYILATAVIRNPRDYDAIRANLIQEIGEQTDDGIYDKHTGVFIEQINLVTDEGFDENGFKKQTREVFLEEDDVPTANDNEDLEMDMEFDDIENASGLKDEAKLQVGDKTLILTKDDEISLTTGNKMLDILNEETFKLTLTPAIVETFDLFMTELTDNLNDLYEQYVMKKPKDMYTKIEYVDMQQTNYMLLIYIYMVELFVSKKKILQKIQVDSNTTVDIHSVLVQYIAQIMTSTILKSKKMRKAWPIIYVEKFKKTPDNVASFMNMKQGDILKNVMAPKMKQMIEQELSLRYVNITKLTYPQTVWPQFLPPQNPQDLFGIQACAELQKNELANNKKSSNHGNKSFLFAKMIFLSYCIQRTIQETLNTDKYKDSLMLNIKIYSQINSCCLDSLTNTSTSKYESLSGNNATFGTTLEFFNENSPNNDLLKRYNNLVKKIEQRLLTVRSITRSFMSNVDTELPYPILSQTLNEEVMREGIEFLGTLDMIQLLPASNENISKQFLQDYVQFSKLTLRGPPQFAQVKLPLIQLITEMKTSNTTKNKDELNELGDVLQRFYKPGADDKNDDVLSYLKQKTANKLKVLPRAKKQQLERTFNMFNIVFNTTNVEDANVAKPLDINNIYSSLAFLRSYIVLIAYVFPMMFKNKRITNEMNGNLSWSRNSNSSWFDFSNLHNDKLSNYVKDKYENVVAFINGSDNSAIVSDYFGEIMEKSQYIAQLSATTFYTPNKKEEVQYVAKVYLALFEYYISTIFNIAETQYNELVLILDDESDEKELNQLKNAKEKFHDFSIDYLKKTAKIDVVDKAYQNIMDIVFKHKENEKNKFRARLEKMDKDERHAYQEDRKLGIGEYNAKNYAGSKKYDADFYDKTKAMRDELQEEEDNFDENEAELMATAGDNDDDDEYANVFENDGY